jgi:hypothetical protein
LLIIKAQIKKIDITKYTLQNREDPVYSFLSLSWAMLSDIDLGSNHIRWMGEKRYTIYALIRCFYLRSYEARYSYIGKELKNKNEKWKVNTPISYARSFKRNNMEEVKGYGSSIIKPLNYTVDSSVFRSGSTVFDEGEWKTLESTFVYLFSLLAYVSFELICFEIL